MITVKLDNSSMLTETPSECVRRSEGRMPRHTIPLTSVKHQEQDGRVAGLWRQGGVLHRQGAAAGATQLNTPVVLESTVEGRPRLTCNIRRSTYGGQHTAVNIRRSTYGSQHPAVNIRRSTYGGQHMAINIRQLTYGGQHKAVNIWW